MALLILSLSLMIFCLLGFIIHEVVLKSTTIVVDSSISLCILSVLSHVFCLSASMHMHIKDAMPF